MPAREPAASASPRDALRRPEDAFPAWRELDELLREGSGRGPAPVEERLEDGALVVRATLTNLDPDEDVEVTVSDRTLHLVASHAGRDPSKGPRPLRGGPRGSLERCVSVPDDVDLSTIVASYVDGILEVRVPLRGGVGTQRVRRVPVVRG